MPVADEEWNEEPTEDSLFLVQGLPGRAVLSGLSGWRGSHATAAELSLPRARRVHSPASPASPSPTSPVAPGHQGHQGHPLAAPASTPAAAANGPRRRHASPAPPPDR